MKRETTIGDYRERVRRVQRHIQEHLDDPLDLAVLARIACFSPFHFHRVFRGISGESVAEHVRRLRLERAAGWLRDSRRPVTRIAFEAGYETHESFIRAFRARFGMAPSEYRRARRRVAPTRPEIAEGGFPERGECRMEVEIRKLPAMRVAAVRHTGPYQECGKAWKAVCGWAGAKGLLGPGTKFIGLSHDDPEVTPSDKIRYDACVTVGADVEGDGEVFIGEIAGGDYAYAMHRGAYSRLNETFTHICGVWGPGSGREFRNAPCLEIYLDDCERTPEEELRTEVYVPLEPRR